MGSRFVFINADKVVGATIASVAEQGDYVYVRCLVTENDRSSRPIRIKRPQEWLFPEEIIGYEKAPDPVKVGDRVTWGAEVAHYFVIAISDDEA